MVIDQAWSGAIGSDGLSLAVDSRPFCQMLADVGVAIGVLRGVAHAAEAAYALTSRQCAELVGEILSRHGYDIEMADLPILSAGACEEVYLYVARRADVWSFLYGTEPRLPAMRSASGGNPGG